ncbi:MAG: DNA polymerase III subunit delta [Elusimicrobia bacterium]|nr:DNA polymerase III subunit delta [Candidatus Liberimonas magnetica]
MPYLKPQELYNQIRSKKFAPIYIFAGEEIYLQAEALKSLNKALEINELNYEIFYGQQSSADTIMLAAQTIPLLSDRRFILVKDAQKIKTAELNKLSQYLKTPITSSCIVFLWQEKLRAENKKSNFFSTAEEFGSIIEFKPLYERDLPAWIQSRIAKSGKEIDLDAVHYLIQESGTSLTDIANEIEKLALFTGKEKRISLEDIETLSGHTKQFNLNNLGSSIESRNLKESIEITENLLNEGEAPLKVLGTIYRTIRKLLLAKSMLEENHFGYEQVRNELRIHPYYFSKFTAGLSKFTHEELKNDLSLILDTDKLLKSSSKPENMIFEELIISILN